MRRSKFVASVAFAALAALASQGALADPPRETGLRGRLVIAREILAAKEWPVDAGRAKALRTPANVRRHRGRAAVPLMEPIPAISVVVEGEDVRADAPPTRKITLEGMRFSPGQALLPRSGPLTIENKQGVTLTILDTRTSSDNQTETKAVATIAPGATEDIVLLDGDHQLSMKELPYARATVKVLRQGKLLPVADDGTIPLVDLPGGDYSLAFFLGAAELRREPMKIAANGLVFIDATISANTVVDVVQRDATLQIAVPVGNP